MSRATELAVKCGAQESRYLVVGAGPDLYALRMTPEHIDAFYHAARAEALMEAAELAWDYTVIGYFREELRAMADREVK